MDMEQLKELMDELDGRVTESTSVENIITKRSGSDIDKWRHNSSITVEDI